jgi:hypothetical protein
LFAYPTIAKLAEFLGGPEVNGENGRIIRLSFPDEYYVSHAAADNQAVYKTKLDPESSAVLAGLSRKSPRGAESILLPAAVSVLAHLSRQRRFSVGIAGDSGQIHMADIDLSAVTGASELFAACETGVHESFALAHLPGQLQTKSTDKQGEALPLLFEKDAIPNSMPNLQLFDLRFSYARETDAFHLMLDYNSRRLDKSKMKLLFGQYTYAVRTLINQYDNRVQAAVSAGKGEV